MMEVMKFIIIWLLGFITGVIAIGYIWLYKEGK